MSVEEVTGVASKIVVGSCDPTFFPSQTPVTGTVVGAWGVFGLPTGSSPLGGLRPRAVLQIGPSISNLPPPGGRGYDTNRSLEVNGDSKFVGDGQTNNVVRIENPTNEDYPLYVDGNAYFNHPNIGDLSQRFNTADARPKPFDMVHPSLGDGNRLRYACIEGPEVAVYCRGRLTNKTEIELPWYWKDLVHTESISVQLQPIGSQQNLIVLNWDSSKIYLQSSDDTPIDCFYHVYAERKDVNSLVVEYEGDSWQDYPDQNYNDPKFSNKINTQTTV